MRWEIRRLRGSWGSGRARRSPPLKIAMGLETDICDRGDDAESHKHEGFLKSLWHNLTNHPAHQQKAEGAEESKEGSAKKDDDKQSGSGTGL